MVAKVLVAIAVGFAVSIPLTFWLLKKVGVKPIRYFQGSSVIGALNSLIAFFLQTRFALFIVLAVFTLILLVIGLEFALRHVVSKSEIKNRFNNGPNGTRVPFAQAQLDSGGYPFDYMNEKVWNEMQDFFKEMARQSEKALKEHGEIEELKWAYQKNQYISISGENYSIFQGIRGTSDSEYLVDSKRVLIFGGSTVFCEETPDQLTIASFLQRVINLYSNSFEVVNCGWSGASVIERSKMLESLITLSPGDSVVFLFGDNDSGWHVINSDGERFLSHTLLPVSLKVMRLLSDKFRSELAKWIYGETAPRILDRFSLVAVGETVKALRKSADYCRSKGARMVAILQPNLYTLRTKSQYESQLEKHFSTDMRNLTLASYRRYEEWVKETPYAVSATHIFDNAPASVFLDWAHVNARGNEIIAKFIFEELQRQGMLSIDSKL